MPSLKTSPSTAFSRDVLARLVSNGFDKTPEGFAFDDGVQKLMYSASLQVKDAGGAAAIGLVRRYIVASPKRRRRAQSPARLHGPAARRHRGLLDGPRRALSPRGADSARASHLRRQGHLHWAAGRR